MGIKGSEQRKRLVGDRTWLKLCGDDSRKAFMPKEWIDEASLIRKYSKRLVDLDMSPEYLESNQLIDPFEDWVKNKMLSNSIFNLFALHNKLELFNGHVLNKMICI